MKGILADVHMGAYVDALIRGMTSDYWIDYWNFHGLIHFHFEDVGLTPTSTDLEIWQTCQAEQLIFITNNRNAETDDSLGIAIRDHNAPDALPVFTIGDLDRFGKSRTYAEKVVEQLFDYLEDIDRVRGARPTVSSVNQRTWSQIECQLMSTSATPASIASRNCNPSATPP